MIALQSQEFNKFIFFLKPDTKQFVPDSKEFSMEVFDEEVWLALRWISKILGKEDENTIDK